MRGCPELSKLPKTGRVSSVSFRRQTPGSLQFTKSIPLPKFRLDPEHPIDRDSQRQAAIIWARNTTLELGATPMGLLIQPGLKPKRNGDAEVRHRPRLDLPFDSWGARVARANEDKATWKGVAVAPMLPVNVRMRPDQIGMSVQMQPPAAQKIRTHQRNEAARRFKYAVNLIVAHGADTVETKASPRIVFDPNHVSEEWILQGWTYCLRWTLALCGTPYPELVRLLRPMLRDLWKRGKAMEARWAKLPPPPADARDTSFRYRVHMPNSSARAESRHSDLGLLTEFDPFPTARIDTYTSTLDAFPTHAASKISMHSPPAKAKAPFGLIADSSLESDTSLFPEYASPAESESDSSPLDDAGPASAMQTRNPRPNVKAPFGLRADSDLGPLPATKSDLDAMPVVRGADAAPVIQVASARTKARAPFVLRSDSDLGAERDIDVMSEVRDDGSAHSSASLSSMGKPIVDPWNLPPTLAAETHPERDVTAAASPGAAQPGFGLFGGPPARNGAGVHVDSSLSVSDLAREIATSARRARGKTPFGLSADDTELDVSPSSEAVNTRAKRRSPGQAKVPFGLKADIDLALSRADSDFVPGSDSSADLLGFPSALTPDKRDGTVDSPELAPRHNHSNDEGTLSTTSDSDPDGEFDMWCFPTVPVHDTEPLSATALPSTASGVFHGRPKRPRHSSSAHSDHPAGRTSGLTLEAHDERQNGLDVLGFPAAQEQDVGDASDARDRPSPPVNRRTSRLAFGLKADAESPHSSRLPGRDHDFGSLTRVSETREASQTTADRPSKSPNSADWWALGRKLRSGAGQSTTNESGSWSPAAERPTAERPTAELPTAKRPTATQSPSPPAPQTNEPADMAGEQPLLKQEVSRESRLKDMLFRPTGVIRSDGVSRERAAGRPPSKARRSGEK